MNNRDLLLETITRVNRRHSRFDPEVEKFYDAVKRNKCLCLFGAGEMLNEPIFFLRQMNLNVDFVCDNDCAKHGKVFFGVKCISYEELKKIKNDTTVFISSSYYIEIENQLKQDDFIDYFAFYSRFLPKFDIKTIFSENKDDIITAFDLLEDEKSREIYLTNVLHASDSLYYSAFRNVPFSENQYFDEEVITLGKGETLVDVGAFDGKAGIKFVHLTREKFGKIYFFELAKSNFMLLCDNISKLSPSIREKIVCVNKGVADNNGSFAYVDDLGTSGFLNSDADTRKDDNIAEVVRLDDFFIDEWVTQINMDIEGAEYSALQGAKRIISEQVPRLAVCVYHNIQDLWTIPLLIKKYNPNYKFYMRHHCNRSPHETVCYAIPSKIQKERF